MYKLFTILLLVGLSRAVEVSSVVAAANETATTISSEPVVQPNATSNITIVNNVARSMNVMPQPAASSHQTTTANVSGGSSVLVICVSLAVVVCAVGLIAGALFVMRKHFNFLKLGGSGVTTGTEEKAEEGSANEPVTSSSNDQLTKPAVQEVNENAAAPVAAENLTSVENKQAIEQIESGKSEAEEANAETPLLSGENQQAVVESVAEEVKKSGETVTEQVSSTSLIANVLNDLSESVVAKLSKSPAKSSSNLPAAVENSQESDKQ